MKDRRFWGFTAVGFISLAGGIFIFASFVPNRHENLPPRDVSLMMSSVFHRQNILFTETGRYSPEMSKLEVDKRLCERYSCLVQVPEKGNFYRFIVNVNGIRWFVSSKSLVPKILKEGELNE
ncbi:MAG: hypothetical protein M9962_06940 [Oligoflexia bacterium]|nr:hypothetical protein [Oligoflexia bacterium]